MLQFPDIDPIAFSVGPLSVRWYGLAYIAGIGIGWALLHARARRPGALFDTQQVADLVFYAAIGAVLGGRIGYILFYGFADFLDNPLRIFAVWRGGMSFHGGVLGWIAGTWWFARGAGVRFLDAADFLVPIVPIGLALGRVANFVNQELWGAPTTLPWGVTFTAPGAGPLPRHPSQLYEAALEGLVLFAVLWLMSRRPRPTGTIAGVFLLLYGVFRSLVEFVREPDAHIGYLAFGWVTMGQVLSLPMIIAGLLLLAMARRAPRYAAGAG